MMFSMMVRARTIIENIKLNTINACPPNTADFSDSMTRDA